MPHVSSFSRLHIGLRTLPLLSLLLLIYGLASILQAMAQGIRFEHLSVEHSLSDTRVQAITQDAQGFMWFGTWDGLNKYDGYSFTIYRHDPEDSTSISNSGVTSLYVDHSDALWVGTWDGLNRFDPATETFSRYQHDPNDPYSVSHDGITAIYEDHQGILWVGTWGGLNRFDPATETFSRYQHDSNDSTSLSDPGVQVIFEDEQGALWVGTGSDLYTFANQQDGGGLNRFDREAETFTRFMHHPDDPHSLIDNTVHAIYEDREGTLWVGTRGDGLHRFERDSETFTRFPYDPNVPQRLSAPHRQGGYREIRGSGNPGLGVTSIHEESTESGILWIGGTDGGLNRFDRSTGTLTHFEHDPRDPNSLSDNDVWSIYEDRAGILWVATWNGINKIDPTHGYFQHYGHDPENPNSLSLGEVRRILEDSDGYLWVATWGGGLNKIDRRTGTVKHYRHDPENPNSLSHDVVRFITEDQDGYLWIGNAAGLNRLDRTTETFTLYQHDPEDPSSLSHNLVNWVHEAQTGTLWVGTYGGGLNRLDRQTGAFTSYRHDPEDPTSLSHDDVMVMLEDQAGNLWIGTWEGGLNRFDATTERFTSFLPGALITCLAKDPSGRLWIGTHNRGALLLDERGELLTSFSKEDGLASNLVRGIVVDDEGFIWTSTRNGLSRIDLLTRSVRNFDVTDGLQGNSFTPVSYYKSTSGELFFGGENGITAFHPDRIKDNPYPPDVTLTGIKIFNDLLKPDASAPLTQHISVTREITLPHDQNDLTFEYVGLHFSNPAENQYAYMLKNYDEDWIAAGTQRTALYPRLPPGAYVFRVKAANSDGVWNEEGASIRVVITPAWWQTWWFRLLAAALAICLLTAAYRYRVGRLLEMERLRLRIASDLHDDIGSNLSAIAMRSEMLQERAARGDVKEHELQRISRAAEETIHALRETIWFIDPKHDRLDDMVGKMRDVAADLLNGIPYTLETPGQHDGKALSMEFRRHVFLIYKEALHNAARHAKAHEVDIRVDSHDGMLMLRIEDDGIGFEVSEQEQGHGLRNMRQRAEQIGGTLNVESIPGKGTTITLSAKMA